MSVAAAKAKHLQSLSEHLRSLVVGQGVATDIIASYIEIHQAGLCPKDRPAGVFLMLGPTGTGKTKTVEAVAEALHGTPKKMLRIDCAEYSGEHEVAKMIGSPPGYLGHRETAALITQVKLTSLASTFSPLSIVLFDEIEKAAPSLHRLLLGVLDNATLRLGTNELVNFESTLIFMTSNLGARKMTETPWCPLEKLMTTVTTVSPTRLHAIGSAAARKKFSPEFVGRIDATVTYRQLSSDDLGSILRLELRALQALIVERLGDKAYSLNVGSSAHKFLLARGTSPKDGARDLKRTIHRELLQPLARMRNMILPGSTVNVGVSHSGIERLSFRAAA